MSQTTKQVKVNHTWTFEQLFRYDENSKPFQEAFERWKKGYRNYPVDRSDGDIEEMLLDISWSVINDGMQAEIEGVGYLSKDGKPFGEPYSGIDVVVIEDGEIRGEILDPETNNSPENEPVD